MPISCKGRRHASSVIPTGNEANDQKSRCRRLDTALSAGDLLSGHAPSRANEPEPSTGSVDHSLPALPERLPKFGLEDLARRIAGENVDPINR